MAGIGRCYSAEGGSGIRAGKIRQRQPEFGGGEILCFLTLRMSLPATLILAKYFPDGT